MVSMGIRVLLADDHEIVREGFSALVEKQPDMEVVGGVADGRMAVQFARELSPDVVVMDVAMPDMNGIEATRRIVAELPQVKVVALSIHSETRYVTEMLKVGASGYLVKNCAFQELARGIATVAANGTYLSPTVADSVVENFVRHRPRTRRSSASSLSDREREVLQLLAEGTSSKESASRLHVTVRTIDAHRQHIMGKLNIHSVAELTKHAIREGITPLDS